MEFNNMDLDASIKIKNENEVEKNIITANFARLNKMFVAKCQNYNVCVYGNRVLCRKIERELLLCECFKMKHTMLPIASVEGRFRMHFERRLFILMQTEDQIPNREGKEKKENEKKCAVRTL